MTDPRTLARPTRSGTAATFALLALLGAALWSVSELRLNVATLVDRGANAVDFLARTVPLDVPPLAELLALVVVELVSGAVRRALLDGRGRAPAPPPDGRLTPPWTGRKVRAALYAATTLVVVVVSVPAAGLSPAQLVDGVAALPATLGLFWPPSTGGILPDLLSELAVTVQIALAATLIGAVLALPVGAMAARNVAPTPGVAAAFRAVIVVIRGIPELIIAIVFVVITGLGPVAGALALAIGAVGLLGKLVADSLEETDTRVQEAVRTTGASRLQAFAAVTLPQAAPPLVAHLLHQLDVNIRSATLLGIVGAGGIGFYLLNASRVLEFSVVTTVMLMVFATVMALELLALWLRRVVS